MEPPIEKYKTLLNINNIKDIAYDTLFTKYIVEDLRGDKKLWEIESTDQESLMIAKNGGFPLPGFIYTFIYPPELGKDKIKVGSKEKEYVDHIPIVFCLGIDKDTFSGINFNFLPNLERVKFLEGYYRSYEAFFKNLEKTTDFNKLALNKKFINFAGTPEGKTIIDIFSKAANANFKYGFRKYKTKKIRNLRMVEYCEWNYIPFYDSRNAFTGMNQKQIQSLYWDKR